MKSKRLKDLEASYEAGALSKEEYEAKKKEIEEAPEEKPKRQEEETHEEAPIRSDKALLIILAVVILIIALLFGLAYLNKDTVPKTIDELHTLNLQEKLDPSVGYIYKGYSFVKQDAVWYTKFNSPSGNLEYFLNFRYGPKELETLPIKGTLDLEKFNNASHYFVTFNPLGKEFSYLRVARFDYDSQMLKVFSKTPKSACDRNATNQTTACQDIPVITCDNTDEMVLYFVEAQNISLEYRDNCIIVEGKGLDFVKGVDRVLYNLYGIMGQ